MEQKRQPSERIRRILQSMERSIDSARDKRLNRNRPVTNAAPPPPRLAAPSPSPREATIGASQKTNDDPSRVKARPKRPNSGFFREWNGPNIPHSKAG